LAYFGPEYGLLETPVIARRELGSSARLGPLIVEEYEGTTVVPPRAQVIRDAYDNIVIELLEEGSSAH
jgi:N-methylhydantoinase A